MGRPRSVMTPQWDKVLRFIRAYMKIHRAPPTYEILAKGLGMSSRSNVHRIVRRLEEEGYLERRRLKTLGIRLVDRSVKDVVSL